MDTSARIMFILFPFLYHTLCLFIYSIFWSYLLLLKFLSSSLYSTDQIQGTVTLKNISTSTSGLYQCTSSNAIGKSTCLLNLQVVERKDTSGHRDCYYRAYVMFLKSMNVTQKKAALVTLQQFISRRQYVLKSSAYVASLSAEVAKPRLGAKCGLLNSLIRPTDPSQ